MSFSNESARDDGINEINMTPLVDVMLVLLIIFIVTIPVVKQAIEIDLPDVAGARIEQTSEVVEISVSAEGIYYFNGELISDEDLWDKFSALAEQSKTSDKPDTPTLQIHGDKAGKYSRIAYLMSMAQRSGLNKIGFVMDGESRNE